ncbi:hypothetical protein F511_11738 [Dorcoceras hygrometricum]|uniref:Uncharacterized protein n=1 Tax=Dorcoceras hygrometricum TaxID=472368 RepID=A0A2Z7C2H3_9LAMI|nr:hypothetical protein F511_11738 [Dorcoceras hygrometricum]
MQQRRQASPIDGKHAQPVRRMSSRAAQSSGKRSASVRNGLRKQPALRPPLAQRRLTRCATRCAAALVQARDASPTMRDGRASFGRHSRDKRTASVRPARAMALVVAPPHAVALGGRYCGRYRQSGLRPEPRLLRQPALEALTNSARTDSHGRVGRKQLSGERSGGGSGDDRRRRRRLMRGRGGGQQGPGSSV